MDDAAVAHQSVVTRHDAEKAVVIPLFLAIYAAGWVNSRHIQTGRAPALRYSQNL
jgi:hypothetical protein